MGIEVKDGVAVSTVGDTVVSLWKLPASFDRVRSVRSDLVQAAEQFPDGFLWLNVILSTSSPPDRAARAELAANLSEIRPRLRKLVVVPLGDSIWHSVVRTIVRTMALLTGLSKQQVVTSTVAEGLALVAELAGPKTPSSQELEATILALCDGLGVDRAMAA